MVEDEADLSLVECLRGRLLAERAASNAAKQEEHLMDLKLKELEAQLRTEIKARKRFEKKLRFLKKKLQTLKIPNILEESEESRSSSLDNNSESSCISSVASTEDPHLEAISQSHEILSNSSDQTESSRTKLEMEDNKGDTSKSQEDNGEVDNSMAIVPLDFPEEDSAAKEVVKIISEDVRDVLGTLKCIREEIQRTMQRRQATRQMIQVA